MRMEVIYRGEFVSRGDNSRWCVSILQELESAPAVVGQLEFPGKEPLLIEWPETSKEEVVCGSTATLKVISPGDRTYAGLYTIEAGRIGVRIEREGSLYWMGTLDPEFYEEPYTSYEDYEVTLTFSDFGILERLKYNLSGMQTLESIVSDALVRAKIDEDLDESLISTLRPGGYGRLSLASLSVRSENFTDEDGEVSDLREVVEGVLQPLGLRLVQRGGKVWVYDLNGLYEGGSIDVLRWHDDDQVLGVDKVANSVKVTFSPYGGSKVLEGECDCNVGASGVGWPVNYYGNWGDRADDGEAVDFTLCVSGDGSGLSSVSRGYFKIKSGLGSENSEGVVGGFRKPGSLWGEEGNWDYVEGPLFGRAFAATGEEAMLVTRRVWLSPVRGDAASGLLLRLTMEMLVDARYNPFSESDEDNWKGDQDEINEDWSYVFVPVGVVLCDEHGVALAHWRNYDVANSHDGQPGLGDTLGSWEAGAGDWREAWLEWYDPDDRKHRSGTGGWQSNRQAVGKTNRKLRRSLTARKQGQYIPYPSRGGWLEVTVYGGLWPYVDNGGNYALGYDRSGSVESQLNEKIRWHLYKAPTVEVVDASLQNEAINTDDIEYRGYLNPSASEELSLETICGTVEGGMPTARGVYLETSSRFQVTGLSRAGRTDTVEHLLIGTLHSQFAERHVKLSGTAGLLTGGLKLWREAMQGVRRFMMLADVQDVDAGTSEAVVVELSGDEYEQGH